MTELARPARAQGAGAWIETPPRGWLIALLSLAGLTILIFRLAGLPLYPAPAADEGNWPIAVRFWLTQEQSPFEYFTAPAYHWALFLPFKLFGPSLVVGRVSSALFGLGALALFYGVAWRIFRDRETAIWSVLLAGTSYAIVLIDRRALIEPMQICVLLGLVFFAAGRSTSDRIGTALALATLLLTKANAIFIIPALVLAAYLDADRDKIREAGKSAGIMAAGTAIAVVVFLLLYLTNPATFLRGWAPGLVSDVYDASSPTGRLAIAPLEFFARLRLIGGEEPFLLAFGLAAGVRQFVLRRHTIIACWLLFGFAFFALQQYWLENHLAVIYPPLVLGTAWLIRDLGRASMVTRGLLWSRVVLLMLVGYSAVRLAGGLASSRDPAAPAVAWLKNQAQPADTVLASPYILMQWPGPVVNIFKLRPQMLPHVERLKAEGVDWVVWDQREWQGYLAPKPIEQVRAAFDECCTLEFDAGSARVYRVK